MRKNNRIVKALLAALMCTFMVTACANTSSKESAAVETKAVETTAAETTAEQKSTTRKVTDMKGVEVEIPMEVNTYVESWFAHNEVDLMLKKAEGMLITSATPEKFPWMYAICPNFYNAKSTEFSTDMNLEEIIAAKPDVVFGSNEDYREMFTNAGIPFINCMFTNYDELKKSVKLTAEVFGGDAIKIADDYIAYLDERTSWVAERTASIPEDQRLSVAHGSSVYELNFDGANTIIDEWIKFSGGKNAAGQEVEGNLKNISIEQVMAWDPDVLITGKPQTEVEKIMGDATWANLSAVKNNKVYSNPKGAFAWDRYGVDAALQPQWCAQILYPDLFTDFSIRDEVKKFYSTFLGYDLSDDEAQMILDCKNPNLEDYPKN
ncbi:ABC transporter substrate-binding protein [Lachnoanaerobaculum sp. Marseille-Q4761]|jgi:ABC transporter, substrate-binding protein|uniref:ABC transporter substrate-binding protein n=1 Tax=Lachnoanaerobaculum sp. Marseille-Q4761 TaxID=2819511 RepID=UPI001AA114B4|nr:ABC transporter substrate-binding protein [Lachnoanaerobaculum sp. Marseille-Q4761]MBO1871501.1 ABC transporter substrate-binding protein [Lachnoanaerobaculum sp. Marseille-Q4761]